MHTNGMLFQPAMQSPDVPYTVRVQRLLDLLSWTAHLMHGNTFTQAQRLAPGT